MEWQKEITESINYGLIDIMLLTLLSEEDMYGYQIRQQLEIRSEGRINIREGALYGPLYRLESKKLVSKEKRTVVGERFRMYYHINESGKQYLEFAVKTYRETYLQTENFITWRNNNEIKKN